MQEKIIKIANDIINGVDIEYKDALVLYNLNTPEDRECLYQNAKRIFNHFCSNKADLCSLINAKSGACREDCKFCAQSAHYNVAIKEYDLLSLDKILERAKEVEANGSKRFCIVTSGGTISDAEFEKVLEAYRLIKQETSLEIDGSLGLLTDERLRKLKEVGISRINHNLETSKEYFSQICTTHTFEDRCNTIRKIKQYGIEVCAGGIIGLGESKEDRLQMAFKLRELEVDSVPLNILNPRPGTPLENNSSLDIEEILMTIAIFRFILPKVVLKIAGGREANLGEYQIKALECGANGIIVGGYLTTKGNPFEEDFALIKKAGLNPNYE